MNKIPLYIENLKIYVVLNYNEPEMKFEIEYDADCGIDEQIIKKEIEQIINDTFKDI